MKEKTIKYPGNAIDVYFTYERCTHVAECLEGAPKVFNVQRRPWVLPDEESADKVAEVIMRCPTGALHFKRKDGGEEEKIPEKNIITVTIRGPYYVHGDIEIKNADGEVIITDTRVALCRCGSSNIFPFCDNSHRIHGFDSDGELQKRDAKTEAGAGKLVITEVKDGPLDIEGPFEIVDAQGELLFRGNRARLCRCGKSKRMPFCDMSHKGAGFKTE